MTKRLLFDTPFQPADEKQRHTAIFNEHCAALSRDILFLSLFCNKNSFSTKSTHFWRIFIYMYILLVLLLQNKHRYYIF